jgi:hypothetical protein
MCKLTILLSYAPQASPLGGIKHAVRSYSVWSPYAPPVCILLCSPLMALLHFWTMRSSSILSSLTARMASFLRSMLALNSYSMCSTRASAAVRARFSSLGCHCMASHRLSSSRIRPTSTVCSGMLCLSLFACNMASARRFSMAQRPVYGQAVARKLGATDTKMYRYTRVSSTVLREGRIWRL